MFDISIAFAQYVTPLFVELRPLIDHLVYYDISTDYRYTLSIYTNIFSNESVRESASMFLIHILKLCLDGFYGFTCYTS